MASKDTYPKNPGDPFSQLQTYFATEIDPGERQEIINGFTKLADKEAIHHRHKEHVRKMKAFCGSKCFKWMTGLVLVGGLVTGTVEIVGAKAQESYQKQIKRQAEATVLILQSADAIRSLNLTADALLAAQQDADADAAKADKANNTRAASGYTDLGHLYGVAAVLATEAHNAGATDNVFIGYPSYVVYVDHGNKAVNETATAVTDVSTDVAVAIDEFLQ